MSILDRGADRPYGLSPVVLVMFVADMRIIRKPRNGEREVSAPGDPETAGDPVAPCPSLPLRPGMLVSRCPFCVPPYRTQAA